MLKYCKANIDNENINKKNRVICFLNDCKIILQYDKNNISFHHTINIFKLLFFRYLLTHSSK